MAVKRITRRWLVNSFGVILVILAALVIAGSLAVREYYYGLVRQTLESRMTSLSAMMEAYSNDNSADLTNEIRSMVANFEDKNRMELMALNGRGVVVITSSGFQSSEELVSPDYLEAMTSPSGSGVHRGESNEEHVMSLSRRAPVVSEDLSAIRLSVSLTAVDKQIGIVILLIVSLGLMVVVFVAVSSSYFINSIIAPLGAVGNAAKRIAQGDFQAKIEKKHDDEIGDLADVINYMADELANADKVKNDFISSVSHELRTPLTAIKGWGETLRDAGAGDGELIKKGMQVIIGETERLSSMVEDLLDFSRMQTGRLSLIMSRMDLVAELSEAVLMFTERAKREGLALLYDEPDIFLTVIGDKNRLRQVFVNILDNALKYSDSGDSVKVTAAAQGDFAVITIADTGIGISQEDLPNVKAKFFKANSTRRGSGIGLAVADEIISLHGGKLSLESTEGKGTTVTIQIPLSTKAGGE